MCMCGFSLVLWSKYSAYVCLFLTQWRCLSGECVCVVLLSSCGVNVCAYMLLLCICPGLLVTKIHWNSRGSGGMLPPGTAFEKKMEQSESILSQHVWIFIMIYSYRPKMHFLWLLINDQFNPTRTNQIFCLKLMFCFPDLKKKGFSLISDFPDN